MAEPAAEPAGPALRGDRPLLAVLAVLVVGLLALGVVTGIRWQHQHGAEDDRAAALRAARSEVLALTTISSKTPEADIDRLLDGATKRFRSEFAQQADNFRQALASGQVVSTGVVTGAAVVRLRGTKADVLVAASGTVTNKQSTQPAPRNYRLRLGMEKVAGRWLVGSLEFVA